MEYGIQAIFGIGLLAVGAATAYYYVAQRKRNRQLLENITRGKQALSDDDYFSQYFAGTETPKEVVTGIRQILTEETGIDFTKISAHEDLGSDLPKILDGMDLVETVMRIESEFNVTITDTEAEKARSVYDLARLVARKTMTR